MKYFYLTFAILFILFAALQWNDPDPLHWIIIYGYMAAICLMVAFGKIKRWLIITGIVVYSVYAAVLAPSFFTWLRSPDRSELFDEFAKMQNLYIEETREFLGLLICLFVLGIIFFMNRKATRTS